MAPHNSFVGFKLWLDRGLAWAQGTYEYRAMGSAVISASDLFRRRDFDPWRKLQAPRDAEYAGQFASLGHLNQQLQMRRKPPPVAAAASARRPSQRRST